MKRRVERGLWVLYIVLVVLGFLMLGPFVGQSLIATNEATWCRQVC